MKAEIVSDLDPETERLCAEARRALLKIPRSLALGITAQTLCNLAIGAGLKKEAVLSGLSQTFDEIITIKAKDLV